ncbi:unnamed protein product [Periconia digitata]|uniref:Zn(2)-C6 fungal-type domain-containing protein n=1 Tax=Periconia digitata TaxID=1303443 RepID=A0A9W4XZA8_9PLEO|nr:unnamed protein product [Periconia digitata]
MASRLDGRSDTPVITRRRAIMACQRCRARRVKCDRAQPACSNCVKVGALCQPTQNSGRSNSSEQSRVGSREPVEQNRLSKLEEQVARLSREVDSRSPSREPSLSPPPPQYAEDHPYLVQGKIVKGGRASAYISPYSWAAAAEEVIDIDSIIGGGASEEAQRFGAPDEAISLIDDRLHDLLLSVFSQRVDPLVHVLHWPSFLERCHEYRQRSSARTSPAATTVPNYPSAYPPGASYNSPAAIQFANPATIPSSTTSLQSTRPISPSDDTFLTLLYSVYYASLVSIVHSPNPPNLDQNNSPIALFTAIKREISTRMSRLENQISRSDSIGMLQAMILYISVELGTSDPQLQWLQLGTAVRMAQSAGLHRDPSGFGFGPIEMESRRRLWAQICIIDTRLADQLCREPTIAPDSYDTILPLSICDQELTEIERQMSAMEPGQMGNVRGLDIIEGEQQDISPISTSSLMLIESEMARQQQQALVFRYQPRDRPVSAVSSSPQLLRRATPFSGRPGRTSWADVLKERYHSRYQWEHLNSSDPIHYLISETCQINVMKATFINRLAQRKETSGPTSTPSGHSEALSIFHDAHLLAARCANLSQQYLNSPYYWYVRRIRDASSCSFLALVLASELPISHEASHAAWTVLDQLFPSETDDSEIQSGVLGKVLAKARAKRVMHEQPSIPQQYREHAINVGGTGYPMNMAQFPQNTFQTPTNIYEDWDTLMQEPVWSGGVSTNDQNYWPSQATSASTAIPHNPSRLQSRPSKQGATYPPPSIPLRSNVPTQYGLAQQLPLPSTFNVSELVPSCKAPYVDAAVPPSHWSPGSQSHVRAFSAEESHAQMQLGAQLTPPSSWPRPLGSLQVPHNHARERSASQPPTARYPRKTLEGMSKRRLTSDSDERPPVYERTPN